ncbi:hypothetical protein GF337_08230 [candidate division KSB1 bacterium]|nr:hypothetical protein [candidate division KSB1 bacterium]
MFELIHTGGPFMLPLVIFLIIIIALSVKKAIELFGSKDRNKIKLESGINAILFWGALSAVFGFLGHYLGVYNAMNAIAHAADISPGIVALGYGISLITILSGLTIFIVSALLWFVFRWRLKQISE